MYVPAGFAFDEREAVVAFMRAHAFALIVTVVDGAPFGSPIPVTIREDGDEVYIRGHLARANPQAAALDGGACLAVFSGPHAYVSPRHYDAVESVPTWNYVTVHASGTARTFAPEDVAGHEALLAELIAEHEPTYQPRWDAASERYRAGMLRGIVGFELRVERLEGKAKLSQNKRAHERRRIAEALATSEDPLAQETARWMGASAGGSAAPGEGDDA